MEREVIDYCTEAWKKMGSKLIDKKITRFFLPLSFDSGVHIVSINIKNCGAIPT
jgi:hypothetical protein